MFAKESKSGKGGIIVTLIITIILALVAYFSCAGGGNFKTEAPDVSTIDGLLSTSLPLPNDGSKPDAHEPNSNAYMAFTSMAKANSFVSHTTGEAITKVAFANVSQKIKSHRVVNKGEVYKESLSHSSFKGVGMRTYVNGGNYIVWESSKVNSVDSVSWEADASKITKDDYISLFGAVPNAYTAYILTDETIIDSAYLGVENGIYSFRYDLNTETATPKMAMEMRTMAGTKSLPLFEKVSLIVRMDEEWRIREIVTDCVYQVDMLGGVTCTESMTEVFDYEAEATIPNGDFLRSYMDAEVVAPLPDELTPTDYLLNGFGEYLTGDKPLRVNLTVNGDETLPIAVNANAEILINMDDLSALSVRADIQSIAYEDLSLSDLFIGYQGGTAYVKLDDLKAYGSIEEITAIINRLIPIFSTPETDVVSTVAEEEETGGFDIASLLSDAEIIKGENVTTVHIPLTLGELVIDANILFNEGETVRLASANITLGGITVDITPDETIVVQEIGNDYHNIAPLFDIIQENGDIPLEIALGDINALVALHLSDMSADIVLGDLKAKYVNNTVYLQYADAKLKFALSDLQTVVDKLTPILEGKVSIPDVNALLQSLDIMALLTQVTDNLALVETDNVLTISTGLEGLSLALRLPIGDAGYSIGSIDISLGELNVSVAPTTAEIEAIPADNLGEFDNIVTLLDIIDENNEINLTATIDTLSVDVNINLETLTILAKTDIFGNTLFIKYFENKVYISYLGLNVYADIADIDSVLAKFEPIIGEIDLSGLSDINVQEIIDNISVVEDENGLTVNATLFGLQAAILFDTTNDDLHIANIAVALGNINVGVTPCEKADYSAMPTGTYYNIVTLLDIIDDSNEINLTATIDTLNVDVNINLETLTILAKTEIFGNTLFVKYFENKVYISYLGLNVYADINDIDSVLAKLEPIIGKVDLSGLGDINVQEIIDNISVVEDENGLTVNAELFGLQAAILFDTADNELHIANIAVALGDINVDVSPADKADYSAMPTSTYYNIVTLLDIINENNEINLTATMDTLNVDVNINLETLTILAKTEIFGNTLFVKYFENKVYISYLGLNVYADINDIDSVLAKLEPIIGKVDLSGLGDINVQEIIDNISVVEDESGLTVNAELFGLQAAILFDTTNDELHIANISVAINKNLSVGVTPCEKADYSAMPVSTYYNIVTLLDIIDENNEINLTVTMDKLNVDVNINLETLTILAKTDIFGNTLFIKYFENKVYISYLGLNVHADITDIDSVLAKLEPIIGEVDLSVLGDINVQEIIDNISVVEDENGLTVNAELFGLQAAILFDTTDNNLHIANIAVALGDVNVNVSTADKADYSAMPVSTYYNIVTLLDIIDDSNEINLTATMDTLSVDVNINLETLTILAKTDIFGNTLFVKYFENKVYISYLGLNVYADIADIDSVLAKLEPIIGEVDLSGLGDINVQEIIDNISVVEDENGLTVNAELFGLQAAILFDTTNNNLHIANMSVVLGDINVNVSPADKANYSAMPTDTYYNIVTLLDIIDENNEINLNATMDTLNVDVNINLETLTILAKADIFGNSLFVKYFENKVYLSYLGLNVYADITDIDSVLAKLEPIIGKVDLSGLGEINVQEIIDNISVIEDENGLTVNAELFGLQAAIFFDTTDNNLHIANIAVALGDINANVSPTEKADYSAMPVSTYYNIVTLLDIIDENNEINLTATMDTLSVDVNINLETLTILAKTDIFGNTLFIKYFENKVYISYLGLNVYADIADIDDVLAKLEPIIGEVDLSGLGNINVQEIIDNISVCEDENGLTVNATLFGINAAILFDTANNELHIANIAVALGDINVDVTPCDKADYSAMPTGTYYNIVTLLDIIDENNEINLTATIDTLNVDVNINLETLTILAKTDIFGNTLFIKYFENKVYISYLGLNVYADINNIDSVLAKLEPIIGEVDLSGLGNINVQEIIDNISVVEDENGLTVNAALFGLQAAILFDTTDNNLHIANMSVVLGDINVNVSPADKADYSAMPTGTYYNIVTLLDIIDENNEINLTAMIDTLQVDVNINLETLTILAKADIFGNTLFVKYFETKVYISYLGLNVYADINDIDSVLAKLEPIIGEVDLSGLGDINVQEIIDNISVVEDENGLTVNAELFGLQAAILFDTADNNLHIANIAVALGDMNVDVSPADKADYSAMPTGTYYNIVTLLDIIDENNEINLTAMIDTLQVDVNINLETLTILAKTEIFGNTLFVKYFENKVYISYLGLNVYADITDIDSVLAKLEPIIGEVDLSGLGDINVQEIIDNISVVEDENGLTVNAELFGLQAAILFDTTNDDLHIANIAVALGDVNVNVAPCEKADYSAMPTGTYYNIVTLLDIIDENNEINLTATIDTLSVDVNINLETLTILAKTDIFGNTLFVKYFENKVYISYLGLNVHADIADIDDVLAKLEPIIGEVDLSGLGDINVQEIIDNISVVEDENGLTVNAELFGLQAAILFDTADNNLHIANISVALGDINVNVSPADKADYSAMPTGTYYNIVTLLDIIDENNEINLTTTIDTLSVDVNINLETLTILAKTDIFGNTLFVKYFENKVYISYLGLNVYADITDIDDVLAKLEPIIGEVDLSGLGDINVQEIIDNISVVENENGLTVNAELFGLHAAILFDTAENELHIANISVALGDVNVNVAPCEKADYSAMPVNTYYNIVTLLDIIDENNEINLTATIDTLSVDVNINLETLTILAKTDIFGNTLFIKYFENKVYISYLGLNVYADITDIDSILAKLEPIIGEVDLSGLGDINAQEIIDNISVSEDENGLTVNAELFGLQAAILFDTTNDDLHIANIAVALGDINVNVSPADKADYSAMPVSTYYNIVTLLNVMNDEGLISLALNFNGTTDIQLTVDLQNMYLYAGVVGVEIFADLNTGDAYVRYPGIQGKVNFNDLNGMLESLQPIIEKFAGDTALSSLDLSGLENFDVATLLSTVTVTEGENTLAIGLNISGITVTVNCLTTGGDLTFDNAAIVLEGANITAVTASEAFTPYFDRTDTYIDAKELVDTFIPPLTDVLTSDTLTATIGGKIVSGATTIEISGNVDIAGLTSAPKAKAILTIAISKTNEDGTVNTSTHEVFLVYKDLTLVAEGASNVYFYYNNLSNASDKLEGTFTTSKFEETLQILMEIYKNMPELTESLKPILIPDENGYPTLPDTNVNVLSMINQVSLANGVLSVNLNGQAFMESLPTDMVANLANENGMLALSIPSLAMDGLSIEGLKVTLGKPADGAITDDTFTYTAGDKVNDFSSINELLKTLENTSKYRSFKINGTVDLNAINIINKEKAISITAQLEVINDKTYAVIHLERPEVKVGLINAWSDERGSATIYFDPEEQIIYTKDFSVTKETVVDHYVLGFIPVYKTIYPETTTYTKYTVDEFTADIANILLGLIHFNKDIEKLIVNSEPVTSTATIENTFLGYAYNPAESTFTIDLDLEPMLGQIQDITLKIMHDSNMNISSLNVTAQMVSAITLTLNADLTTYEDGEQTLYSTIATERIRPEYNK